MPQYGAGIPFRRRLLNYVAAGDIHLEKLIMAKKHKHRSGWEMKKRPAKNAAPAARRAAMEDARAKCPALYKKNQRISPNERITNVND
jgi:hypothetical protein